MARLFNESNEDTKHLPAFARDFERDDHTTGRLFLSPVYRSEREAEREAKRKAEREAEQERRAAAADDGPLLRQRPRGIDARAKDELLEFFDAHTQRDDELPVCTREAFAAAINGVQGTGDRDFKERDLEVLKAFSNVGPYRRAGFAPAAAPALDALARRMPHFGEVLSLYAARLRLGAAARRPARLPPVLLVGPPGIGKSHFSNALAAALGERVTRVPMDQEQGGATLQGTDRHFVNSRPGVVFEALVGNGASLNPIVLLDELDKARQSREYDPIAPLHGLLEPVTARRFTDRGVRLELDASRVVWVATANETDSIPAPLLSRFQVFQIEAPSAAASRVIARSVVASALRELGLRARIEPAALDRLARLGPRAQVQAIEDALAAAVARGEHRLVVREADLPKPPAPRQPMGFAPALVRAAP